jgi:hypothetical protein
VPTARCEPGSAGTRPRPVARCGEPRCASTSSSAGPAAGSAARRDGYPDRALVAHGHAPPLVVRAELGELLDRVGGVQQAGLAVQRVNLPHLCERELQRRVFRRKRWRGAAAARVRGRGASRSRSREKVAHIHSTTPGWACSGVKSAHFEPQCWRATITSDSSRPASVGSYIEPGPSGLGRMSSTPARSRSRNRFESRPRDRPGAQSAISLKVRQPRMTMLRRMMIDQRSARSSEAR